MAYKPEYAACIAAIKLRGEPEDDREENWPPASGAEIVIKICDPAAQQLIRYHTVAERHLRGVQRHTFIVHEPRNYAVISYGDGGTLPTASHRTYARYDVERADPDNPDETYWMLVK